jgi:hypothetical protein
MSLFEQFADTCSSPGERLIVLMTSDTPCQYPGALIGDPGTPYGGTLAEAYQAADDAAAAGISIAPVLINFGAPAVCAGVGSAIPPQQFLRNMTRGFIDDSLNNPNQFRVNRLLQEISAILPIRMVE